MKVLVTGVAGQLGHDVVNELAKRGAEAIGSGSRPEYSGEQDGSPVCTLPYLPLNVCDREAVRAALLALRPDAVVHCSAWTAVDAAEEPEVRDKVRALNSDAPGYIAEACSEIGAKLVFLSTDYVFDGQGTEPWEPDSREFAPLNVYGSTKLAGEQRVCSAMERYFILRISWVFGRNGKNFVKTMLKLAENHDSLRVVSDQIGTPTYTRDLAVLLCDMLETERYGFYHVSNEGGFISWYDFACEIFRQAGKTVKVVPVTTEEYGASRARRPMNSRLSKKKLTEKGFRPLPDWQDALGRYLQETGVIEWDRSR